MTKLKIKKGDKVVVISGGSKGKEGEVLYGDGKGCHMGLF